MGLSDLVTDHFHSCSLAFTGHFMSFWRFTAILRFETHPYPPSNRGSGDLTTADWNQVATLASEDQRTEAVRIPKRGSQHFLGNKMHRNHLEVSIGVPPVIIHWDFPPKKKTAIGVPPCMEPPTWKLHHCWGYGEDLLRLTVMLLDLETISYSRTWEIWISAGAGRGKWTSMIPRPKWLKYIIYQVIR